MKIFRCLLVFAVFAFFTNSNAQEKPPVFEEHGELIKGTFYYEDGSVRQEGTYKDGKLHGKWISYGQDGKKNALAEYAEGQKTGKWFFWSNGDVLNEVDYSENRIAEVKVYKNTGERLTVN
ncbi:nicotinic acid mononucleotide adenyltransferase [Antarcticibacterium flavum]|uniref:Nicotinic acid mononucleotide adenyltransferase n=1 Tax=Antarcticibacterium flavum TaxID=2058175 RepID=A0A5B7X4A7_9FLAO|nr:MULTISPECIES: nicotinic acid mononucleotide adenyltransferase [Antarcticibacterium]MCM4159468.1 nicotinic acid mononucleotide adenyltransferase [Antarcticibacterium sp. W02-3]QCY69895.1 nicotinic acid mononucleotide adenyltransferase [Antarcticibacterium flavum]